MRLLNTLGVRQQFSNFQEWVGEGQYLALRFFRGRRKGSAFKSLDGALHTDGGGCTLSVGLEVKMEIPTKAYPAMNYAPNPRQKYQSQSTEQRV